MTFEAIATVTAGVSDAVFELKRVGDKVIESAKEHYQFGVTVRDYLKWAIRLPTPKELGWSDMNALPVSCLASPFGRKREKTWEDWQVYVKENYPIRYFFREELPRKVLPYTRKLKDAVYWVKCHTLKDYRFHLLDFRGVDPLYKYTHGYMDPYGKFELAGWACLRDYVENHLSAEERIHRLFGESEEEWEKNQIENHNAVMDLYTWWTATRLAESDEEKRLFEVYDRLRESAMLAKDPEPLREDYEKAEKAWSSYHAWREQKNDTMFRRLVYLRHFLWN